MSGVVANPSRRIRLAALVWLGSAASLHAAPGDELFSDNFNGNLNSWTVTSSGGNASIGNETSQQGRALRLRFGAVTITSDPFNAAVPGAQLDVWVRRGADSFSENPDNNEDLIIEYSNDTGTWVEIQRYDGGGTPGEILTPRLVLPADALHGALQIRFRVPQGGPEPYDYWHVDNPTVTETAAAQEFGLGSCQDFESGLGSWTVVSAGGSAGVSTETAGSGVRSAFTGEGAVSVVSQVVDLASAGGLNVAAWIRRGADSFSEDPDGGEDLAVEYLDDVGNWVLLETFAGNGSPGVIVTPTYSLPAAAAHAGFRLRFRQLDGDSGGYDFWHIDDICLTGDEQGIAWFFEEDEWTGTADEVEDASTFGLDGTVSGGGLNTQSSPAIAGNPGTCRYADFDGVDDYIEVPDSPELDMETAFTVTAWINARSIPRSDLHTIVSKDWNYEFHLNSSGRIFWFWNNASGRTRTLTSSVSIGTGQWHHVAITYASGSQVIYLDGSPVATSSETGNLRLNDRPFFIGTDWNFISRAWDGFIDEVNVIGRALTVTDVQTLMMETRPCASVAPQFAINHDGFGIHCLAETITVDVVDASAGTPLTDYNATVVLDSQSGRGTWQLIAGGGTLADTTSNDGVATYAWPLTESRAVFELFYPEGAATIDVDVYQQSNVGIRDTDVEGALEFSASRFTVTSAALANPPPSTIVSFNDAQIAGTNYALHIAAYGQTSNDPACGIIESYDGPKALSFWGQYQNPAAGVLVPTVNNAAIGSNEVGATAQSVTFTNGQAVVNAKYKDVGQIRINMKDETPGDPDLASGIRGATAGFVVKPFEFLLTDIQGVSATPNPAAADANGGVFIAAGAPFSATVTALDAEGSVTPSYGRESVAESVRLNPGLVAPLGGSNPPITSATSFTSFVSGTASGVNFTWPEVGIITLTPSVADGDYLGAGDVIGRLSGNVGRFIPAYFDVVENLPTFATACSAGGFTYIGEPFNYSTAPELTLTAKAVGGATTNNYAGAFFKLSGLPLPVYNATPNSLDTSGLPASGDPTIASTGGGMGMLAFSGGSGFRFTRNAEEAPFSPAISFSQSVVDTDGVAAASNPVIVGNAGGILFDSGAEMRFGRTRIENAYGSERVNLPVSLVNEYFVSAGIGFVPNSNDDCSTLTALTFTDFTDSLVAGDTCILDSGNPGASGLGCASAAPPAMQFKNPAESGNHNLILQAPGDGNDGSLRITADVPAWLEYDWSELTPGNEAPSGNATFGIYGGRATRIYTRELY